MNQSGDQHHYGAFNLGHSLGGGVHPLGEGGWYPLGGAWAVHLQVLMTQARGE